MDTSLVLHLARRVLEISLLLSGPSLAVTLVVGFVTGILQAVTSVRDQSMGMVVKLAAVGVTLLATGGRHPLPPRVHLAGQRQALCPGPEE